MYVLIRKPTPADSFTRWSLGLAASASRGPVTRLWDCGLTRACVHILVLPAAKLFSSRVKRGRRRSRCSPPQCPNICSQLEAAAKLTFSTTHGPSLSPSQFFIFFHPVPFPVCPSFQSLVPLPPHHFVPHRPSTPTPPPAAGSCLPPCLFEGVHFTQTLGGRGMLSGGCRQTHMFRTFMGGLTSRRRHSVFSRGQCCLLQRSN